jgi:hypothetical protein
LLKQGKTPGEAGLGDDVRTPDAIELLEHLQRQWSFLTSREQRRHPRQPVKKLVGVVHGISDILKYFAPDADNAQLTYSADRVYKAIDDVHIYGYVRENTKTHGHRLSKTPAADGKMESWVMHDESRCGYGAVVETDSKDWLRVGVLIATYSEQEDKWSIGILRRLSRLNENESSVGIETLPEIPGIVMLSGKGRKAEGYSVNGIDTLTSNSSIAAIQLSPCEEGKVHLILDSANYQHHGLMEIQQEEEKHLIQLGQPIERGEGWIRLTADLIGSHNKS